MTKPTPLSPLSLQDSLPDTVSVCHTLPSLFISHGAPTIAIEPSTMTHTLGKIGQNLPKPRLIIIMSAHWHSHQLEINANPVPATWHDFTGFSAKLYQIQYPAKGSPEVAQSLAQQLENRDIAVSLNQLRPLDHGVWTPLCHLYPAADVPIVQLSLPQYFDSYACYQLGAVLAPLRHEQVLIIGSGSVTHNLGQVKFYETAIEPNAHAFKQWLIHQLKTDLPAALAWHTHPLAAHAHPSHEHLLPLFFAAGAGTHMSVVHESTAHYSLGMDIYRFD